MNVKPYYNNSCAVSAIEGLGDCRNAVQAMQFFCRTELGVLGSFIKNYGQLACFYTFCAGPEVPSSAPGGSHHSKAWVRYGTEFAAFITTHELGEVVTVGPKKNLKHHPKSTAQLWTWSPDREALIAWWENHQKETICGT
jgi:hypothetical protein